MSPRKLAQEIAFRVSDRNASDITLLDIRQLSTIAEFFVICTATSTVHAKALSEDLCRHWNDTHKIRGKSEGSPQEGWVVVDFGSILAHIFLEERRTHYALERLWSDAPVLVQIL
tara:strand:+ start:651 stop:995 length:345 start_codon:yes stop_codon:yes gene_type:complete